MSDIQNIPDKGESGICGGPTPTAAPTPVVSTNSATPLELHACAGLNACQGHDRFGSNACAGMGYCATQAHVCHTLNNCRGQGGCGLYGSPSEQCRPAENECAFQGSCATPIQLERFSTLGPNAGKSVWILARKLFEERMAKGNRHPGASPFPAGPPQAWLQSLQSGYDSCGASGNKSCSFGYNNPAVNAQELVDKSKRELSETLKECACTPNPDGGNTEAK